jgi:FKBP-type peptidyl-prolyl cis-trans isomerase
MAARFPDSLTLANTNLRYIVRQPGEGETPKVGATLVVHYTGTLWDGTQFDSSVERGQPFRFRLGTGQVIKGWDLGFSTMRPGEKRLLIIPYSLAYGDRGRPPTIPQRATLLFEVELIAIE